VPFHDSEEGVGGPEGGGDCEGVGVGVGVGGELDVGVGVEMGVGEGLSKIMLSEKIETSSALSLIW